MQMRELGPVLNKWTRTASSNVVAAADTGCIYKQEQVIISHTSEECSCYACRQCTLLTAEVAARRDGARIDCANVVVLDDTQISLTEPAGPYNGKRWRVRHLHDTSGLCRCQTVSDTVRHMNTLPVACRVHHACLHCRINIVAHSSVVSARLQCEIRW